MVTERLNLIAGSSDVSLGTNLVRLTPDFPLAPVTLNIRLDGTSQEMNETFSLSFVNFSPSLIRVLNSSTPGELNGTIIDKDCEWAIERERL